MPSQTKITRNANYLKLYDTNEELISYLLQRRDLPCLFCLMWLIASWPLHFSSTYTALCCLFRSQQLEIISFPCEIYYRVHYFAPAQATRNSVIKIWARFLHSDFLIWPLWDLYIPLGLSSYPNTVTISKFHVQLKLCCFPFVNWSICMEGGMI